MGKFLVVHPVGADMTPEAAAPVAKAVKASCGPDAYWVRSWYVPEEGKLYCEWDARDSEAVSQAMTAAAQLVPQPPVQGIYAIAAQVTGEDFR
ncbi:MAG: DUF4242 domain-containing protein [Actinobacteria bacterium]|nr:DUF4242 domain-containing protein [Actinomycetota bacterium]